MLAVGLIGFADSMNNAPDESCVESWNRFADSASDNKQVKKLRNSTVFIAQTNGSCAIAGDNGEVVLAHEQRAVSQEDVDSGEVSRDELIAWKPDEQAEAIDGSTFDGDTSSGKYRTDGEGRITGTNILLFWR